MKLEYAPQKFYVPTVIRQISISYLTSTAAVSGGDPSRQDFPFLLIEIGALLPAIDQDVPVSTQSHFRGRGSCFSFVELGGVE